MKRKLKKAAFGGDPFGPTPWLAPGQPNPLVAPQLAQTPFTPGNCPNGYIWDTKQSKCIKQQTDTTSNLNSAPPTQTNPQFQMKSQATFGNINYGYRALSNSIQGIAAFFRESHSRSGQNAYRNQFNPLTYIQETGNTSQQNQFGMDYYKKGGHLLPKDTMIHGKKISAKQRKFFSDLCAMEEGGLIKYPDGGSIVDYLKSQGQASDKTSRKALAEKYGVEGYDLSANKNLELLAKLRAEKFKKDNKVDKVVYIQVDNGSQGRTYQTKDKKMTGEDWRDFDLRDDSGGAGFYLKGKGYKQGGNVKYDEGGAVNFDDEFENDLFGEPAVDNTKEQENPNEQAQENNQEETTKPQWMQDYFNGTDPRRKPTSLNQQSNNGDIVEAFKNGIAEKESGGDYYAVPRKDGKILSSAYGKYQFLKGTREEVRKNFFPNVSSKDFEVAYKTDPEFQEKVMDVYSKYLLSKYQDPHQAAIAFFLGEGKANKVNQPNYNPGNNNSSVWVYLKTFDKGFNKKFEAGGEYELSEDEINDLIKQGYQIDRL